MSERVKTAMIFAAGLGTRLKPITDTMPKALVPYNGTPLLERVINNLKEAGFTRIVINVHHFADMVEEFVAKNNNFGVEIVFSDERDLLRDTGGGLKHAEPLLFPDNISQEPILVHNVDIVTNLDLKWFYQRHLNDEANNIVASLLVSDRKTSRYFMFDDDNRLVGWTNLATGEVKSPFPNINIMHCKLHAFGGIHIISPSLLKMMNYFPEKFSIVDFYLSIAEEFTIRGVPVQMLKLVDVGKISMIS